MSLKQWDQQTNTLAKNIESVIGFKAKESNRAPLNKEKEKLNETCKELEENLSLIFSMSIDTNFISKRGKALLFWAQKLCSKLEKYYFLLSENMSKHLLLKFIELRCTGTKTSFSQNISQTNLTQTLNDYQIRILKIDNELNQQIKILETKKSNLHLRYNRLGVAKANYQSSSSLEKNKRTSSIIKLMDQYLKESRANKAIYIGSPKEQTKNIDQLSIKARNRENNHTLRETLPKPRRKNKKSKPPSKNISLDQELFSENHTF